VLRGVVVGWTAGVVVLGLFYGIVADQAEQMLEESPEMEDFFAQLGQGSIVDAFLSVAVLIMGLLAAGFVVAAVLRQHTEESAGRADPLLATPTPRRLWAGSHLAASGLGMLVVLVGGGLATGIGSAISLGEPSRVLQLVAASLTMATGAAVMAGIAFLLWAAAPRWSLFAWVLFAAPVIIGLLGEPLGLPDWALNLSPFQHVPALPAASFSVLPVALLLGVAAALVAAGLLVVRHRDVGRG
jgi:ABC-2 type transport system permease protein